MNIDYNNLGFSYTKTNYSYLSYWKDDQWDDGRLTEDDKITISATSPALHYAQQGFEGLKAYRWQDGSIHLFRIDENAKRLKETCRRMLMPEVPVEKFIQAVKQVVLANHEYVPPFGSGATLYIRPYIIGVGDNMGLRAAKEYIFGIITTPVGPYYKGGLTPVNFLVTTYDRAAPNGTGGVKVGGNYAASLYPSKIARDRGFAECIYLDPATHTKIEEAGAANFFAITKDKRFITPISPSILPGITKKSLIYLANEYLGLIVEERDIYIDQLDEYVEVGACGTAAVISPIGGIYYQDKLHVVYSETEVGPITKKLYDTLTKIQFGELPAPEGWIFNLE